MGMSVAFTGHLDIARKAKCLILGTGMTVVKMPLQRVTGAVKKSKQSHWR